MEVDPMATKKNQETTLLAQRLQEWTTLRGVQSDPYLRQLIAALTEGKNLHIWAELNPLEYLPHPTSMLHANRSNLVRILTIIRNVLVFAPVALTWAAVGAATKGFAAYTKANGASVVNFLDFWQNGHGFLAAHWRIGSVAQLDFLIILAVIALTLYLSIYGHKFQNLRADQEIVIDQERAEIALEISHALHDKRKITAVTMNQALAGSISRLIVATKNLESAAKEINKLEKKRPRA